MSPSPPLCTPLTGAGAQIPRASTQKCIFQRPTLLKWCQVIFFIKGIKEEQYHPSEKFARENITIRNRKGGEGQILFLICWFKLAQEVQAPALYLWQTNQPTDRPNGCREVAINHPSDKLLQLTNQARYFWVDFIQNSINLNQKNVCFCSMNNK